MMIKIQIDGQDYGITLPVGDSHAAMAGYHGKKLLRKAIECIAMHRDGMSQGKAYLFSQIAARVTLESRLPLDQMIERIDAEFDMRKE